MKKANRFKIYSLALYYLVAPKTIKHRFHFNTSGIENLAIGVIMTKIKYWKSFIYKRKLNEKIIISKTQIQ